MEVVLQVLDQRIHLLAAPGSPAIGDFWHDTTNDKLYIRTNDGSSNIWLQV